MTNLGILCASVDYMVEKLGIDQSKIAELGNLLYKNYGTTMAGLRVKLFWPFLVSNLILETKFYFENF